MKSLRDLFKREKADSLVPLARLDEETLAIVKKIEAELSEAGVFCEGRVKENIRVTEYDIRKGRVRLAEFYGDSENCAALLTRNGLYSRDETRPVKTLPGKRIGREIWECISKHDAAMGAKLAEPVVIHAPLLDASLEGRQAAMAKAFTGEEILCGSISFPTYDPEKGIEIHGFALGGEGSYLLCKEGVFVKGSKAWMPVSTLWEMKKCKYLFDIVVFYDPRFKNLFEPRNDAALLNAPKPSGYEIH